MIKRLFEALRPRREQTREIIDDWFAISRSSDSDNIIDVYVCMHMCDVSITNIRWRWWRPISFSADQGLLSMKTSSARWKSRGERDSISDRRSGRRNYVTAVLSRATSRLFLFYSLTHVRIIDSRVHMPHCRPFAISWRGERVQRRMK